jgi:hypothetical protein
MNIPEGATVDNTTYNGATIVKYVDAKGVNHIKLYREGISNNVTSKQNSQPTVGFVNSSNRANVLTTKSGITSQSNSKYSHRGASEQALSMQSLLGSVMSCAGGGDLAGRYKDLDMETVYGSSSSSGNSSNTILGSINGALGNVYNSLNEIESKISNGIGVTQEALNNFDKQVDTYRNKLSTNGLNSHLADFDSIFNNETVKNTMKVAGCMSRSNAIMRSSPLSSLTSVIDSLSNFSSFIKDSLNSLRSGVLSGPNFSSSGAAVVASAGSILGLGVFPQRKPVVTYLKEGETAFGNYIREYQTKLAAHATVLQNQSNAALNSSGSSFMNKETLKGIL